MSSSKLKRHNEPWKSAELVRLRAYAAARKTATEAAGKLGRSPGAVKYKAMMERIRFHNIEQPIGPQKKLARRRKRFGMRATLAA